MILELANVARDYAWGSKTLISDYFAIPETGNPMAEIWFGTHPGSPTKVLHRPKDESLLQARNGKPLSYLLKILAADQPLSIQAHPSIQQARAGFAAENSAGVSLDAPNRNYKDDNHKPEMLVALTEFHALAGFRAVPKTQQLLKLIEANATGALKVEVLNWTSLLATGLRELFTHLANSEALPELLPDLVEACERARQRAEAHEFEHNLELVKSLQQLYPGDFGIVVSLLMNYLVLQPNQAVQLPAGNIHAYVSGLGVEIMAASDNVLRGGLTPKHVDVPELLKVVEFVGQNIGPVEGKQLANGLVSYDQPVDDYQLYRIEVSSTNMLIDIELPGATILLCTAGEVAVSDSLGESLTVAKGKAAYVEGARLVSFSGSGTAFLATAG